MTSEKQHHILIVEGDRRLKKTIESILTGKPVSPVFCDTGDAGIEYIETSEQPLSLIISALRLTGMDGSAFLERAKKIAPNAIRYLMAAPSDLETIIGAVNQRAVHRFFVKPFEHRDFLRAVSKGVKLHESVLEHKQLLKLAKQQNVRLYDLNCEMVATKKKYNHTIQELEHKIETLNKDIAGLDTQKPWSDKNLDELVLSHLDSGEGVDVEKFEHLFSVTIQILFDRFEEMANRNGFEMNPPGGQP